MRGKGHFCFHLIQRLHSSFCIPDLKDNFAVIKTIDMKKAVFTFSLIILHVVSIGQGIDTTSHPTNLGLEYKERSKNGKTAGFIMLGAGIICFATGGSMISSNFLDENPEGMTLAYAGAGLVLGSIPVFIFSGINKRKSRLLLQKSTSANYYRSGNTQQTAIVWKLDF